MIEGILAYNWAVAAVGATLCVVNACWFFCVLEDDGGPVIGFLTSLLFTGFAIANVCLLSP